MPTLFLISHGKIDVRARKSPVPLGRTCSNRWAASIHGKVSRTAMGKGKEFSREPHDGIQLEMC